VVCSLCGPAALTAAAGSFDSMDCPAPPTAPAVLAALIKDRPVEPLLPSAASLLSYVLFSLPTPTPTLCISLLNRDITPVSVAERI
jgi:hypothetical protein